MIFLKTLTIVIFIFIAGIHIYWSLGGLWGTSAAIPTVNGSRAFTPSNLATFIVALAIAGCGLLYSVLAFSHNINVPVKNILSWLGWIVTLIFIARAIGDFHLVGFFKTINGTKFAMMDTKYYSPLCLLIGLNFAYVTYNFKYNSSLNNTIV